MTTLLCRKAVYVFITGMRAILLWMAVVGLAGRVGTVELIVNQVPTSLLANTNAVPFTMPALATPVLTLPAAPPARWEKFEAEFGLQPPSQSLVKNTLSAAKYQLDRTSFALQEFADTIRNRLQFDYGLEDIGLSPRAHGLTGNPITDALSRIRLQSDIDLKVSKTFYFGVKLVLPIGN